MPNDPWSEWLASPEGCRCKEMDSLPRSFEGQRFLENRLWMAFHAGLNAAEKSSPIANSERGSDNG